MSSPRSAIDPAVILHRSIISLIKVTGLTLKSSSSVDDSLTRKDEDGGGGSLLSNTVSVFVIGGSFMLGGNFVVLQKVTRLFLFNIGDCGNEGRSRSFAVAKVAAGVDLLLLA